MLSVVINTYNESGTLKRVVDSVRKLAEEIVVIDTQSTDNTVAIAKKMGCVVYSHPKVGIVELVRNFSISKAKGDWILLLDADEEIQPKLAEYIKKTISEDKVDYCRIPRKNIIFNSWIKSDHWWPDYAYRLFKKDAILWQETIHSIPITTGIGYDFPSREELSIIHHNYQSISQFLDRLNRYTDFQSQELLALQTKFNWTDIIVKPTQEFLSQYFARKGYQEGIHGLVLSLLQAFSYLIVYLKLWEKSGFQKASPGLSGIKNEVLKSTSQFHWWYWHTRISDSHGLVKLYWQVRKFFRL
jgi:glycosyltransferase involved in cell wall biosynthesis